MTVRLYFARQKTGSHGWHLVPSAGGCAGPEWWVTYCGEVLVAGECEQRLAPDAAPCARCVGAAWLQSLDSCAGDGDAA